MVQDLKRAKQLHKNVSIIYSLGFFRLFMLFMPIAIPFFQSIELNMTEVMLLQSIFGFTVVLLEVPSGYLSDLLNRRKVLIISSWLWCASCLLLAISNSFSDLVMFEVLCAVSLALYSGTDTAILYDSLEELKKYTEDKFPTPSHFLGKKLYYQQIGETIAGFTTSGIIAYFLWGIPKKTELYLATQIELIKYPIQLQFYVSFIPLFIVYLLTEPKRVKFSVDNHGENVRTIVNTLIKNSRLLKLCFYNLMIYGCVTLVAAWVIQRHWTDAKIDILHFGWLWAIFNLTVAIAARLATGLEQRLGSSKIILLVGILPIIGFLGMGTFITHLTWLGVLLGLSFQFTRGLTQVVIKDAVNSRVESAMRATVNSIVSLGVRAIFFFVGPAVGFLIDHPITAAGTEPNVQSAFYVLAAVMTVSFFFFCIPLRNQVIASPKNSGRII